MSHYTVVVLPNGRVTDRVRIVRWERTEGSKDHKSTEKVDIVYGQGRLAEGLAQDLRAVFAKHGLDQVR